jgi:hypothetical protein
MTSRRQIEANRHNSRKSCGPRSAAGKAKASRNALRHGLAVMVSRPSAPAGVIETVARAICGDDADPQVFALAVKVAENEIMLEAIRTQQVAMVERLREPYARSFGKPDNPVGRAKGKLMAARLAAREINARLPQIMEKYKDQMPPPMKVDENLPHWLRDDDDDIVPIRLKALLHEPDPAAEEKALELARKQIEERDEYEALEAAIVDLIRLDRYQRRAWSRQKKPSANCCGPRS